MVLKVSECAVLRPIQYDDRGRPTYEWVYDAYVTYKLPIREISDLMKRSDMFLYVLLCYYGIPKRVSSYPKAMVQPNREAFERAYLDKTVAIDDIVLAFGFESRVSIYAWRYAFGLPCRRKEVVTNVVDVEEVYHRIQYGETLSSIAKELGVKYGTLYSAFYKLGYRVNRANALRNIPKDELVECIAQGDSLSTICRRYHCGLQTLRTVLQEYGISYKSYYRGIRTGHLSKSISPEFMQELIDEGFTMTEIAEMLHKHLSTISKAIKRWGLKY